jgi:hypothetical protein
LASRCCARYAAGFGKRKTSERAPERGEGDRREREEAMAHRRRRILPVTPADVRRSDERFCNVLEMDLRRGKGDGSGPPGVFIGARLLAVGARVRRGASIKWWPAQTCRGRTSWPDGGDDRWARVVSEGEKGPAYPFGS